MKPLNDVHFNCAGKIYRLIAYLLRIINEILTYYIDDSYCPGTGNAEIRSKRFHRTFSFCGLWKYEKRVMS